MFDVLLMFTTHKLGGLHLYSERLALPIDLTSLTFEVIHLRCFGDHTYQFEPWALHNAMVNRATYCILGTDGAELISSISVESGERVFDIINFYDTFMVPVSEPCLKRKGFKHLVFVGLFGDACLDTIARSAFQRGFHIGFVRSCIGTMDL